MLPETFFLRGADCWGWGTWARAWQHFRADGAALLMELRARRLTRIFDFGGAFRYTQMLEATDRRPQQFMGGAVARFVFFARNAYAVPLPQSGH